MTLNKHEVWNMKEYGEGLGIDFHLDPLLNMRVDGGRRPAKFRLHPEELLELDLTDEKIVKEWHEFCDRFGGPPSNPEYLCGAGIGTFHVDPYGQYCVASFDSKLQQGEVYIGVSGFAEPPDNLAVTR